MLVQSFCVLFVRSIQQKAVRAVHIHVLLSAEEESGDGWIGAWSIELGLILSGESGLVSMH
jgi:hypothetical protein